MSRNSEWITGTSVLAGVDGWCRTPFAPGVNMRDAAEYVEHFFPMPITSTTAMTGWTVTQLTSGTLVDNAGVLGVLDLTNTTDAQGIQAQANGVWFTPAAGKYLWVEFGVNGITDADDMDWFLGFAATDTNLWSTDPTEIIAFRGDDGDANIDFQVRNGGTGAQADTTVDTADGAAFRVGFFVNGVTSVTPYVNGTAYTAVTTNIPTAAVRLTIGTRGGATANPNVLSLDWIRVLATA